MRLISLALAALTPDFNYDVFVEDSGGSPILSLSPAWASDTARTLALVRQDGVLVASGAATRRYVGTFRTVTATTTRDELRRRWIYSYTNRVSRSSTSSNPTTAWVPGNAWAAMGGGTWNEHEFVIGVDEDAVESGVSTHIDRATGTMIYRVAVSTVTTGPSAASIQGSAVSAVTLGGSTDSDVPNGGFKGRFSGIGFRTLYGIDRIEAGGTGTIQAFAQGMSMTSVSRR